MNQTIHAGTPHPDNVSYLCRPRIDQFLKESFQKPLTAIVAGAGYGKTHAVSSALEAMPCQFAWLHLSEPDNIIGILWKRLAYAIEIHDPSFAEQLLALGYPDSPALFHQLLRMLELELRDSSDRFMLVLDDFHMIQDEIVLDFLGKITTSNVTNLSIVLLSREKPRIPLAGMLAKGLMARITEDDLRFSKEEMEAYYQLQGESFDSRTTTNLYAYTEGWVLAIYLVGLTLKRKTRSGQNPTLQANIDIFALIEEEIFQNVSKNLQRFLLSISLLDVIPSALLKKLAADTPQLLTEMTRSSQLIRYDPHSDSYYMHRLFRDFLHEKKGMLTDAEIQKTHRAAGQWFLSHQKPAEAIGHYRECGDYSEVFDIILSVRGRVPQDGANLFISLIDQAPAELLKARPIMRVVKALYLMNNNRILEAKKLLSSMQAEYEALPRTKEHLSVLGEVYVLLALIYIILQNVEFVLFFQKADKCLPDGSILIDSQYHFAEGFNVIGIQTPAPGELKRFQDALFAAAPYATKVLSGCSYGMEYLNATDVAIMTGNFQEAEKSAYATINLAQQRKQYSIEYMANFYLIRIFIFKGDYAKIALLLRQMKERAERLQNVDCMTLYDIIEGWFLVKIGKTDKVAKWILQEEETRKMLAPVVLGREYLVRSDCLLAEGKYYELLGFMKQSDVFYGERRILYALIQNRISESIIYHYLGKHQESMDALEVAYRLSHANHLVFQYIEYGSKMRTVAQAALQDRKSKLPRVWLENLQTKSSTYAKRLSQVIKDYEAESLNEKQNQIQLSKKELEILSCLCHGFTREEIADNCSLSSNTVRSVLQSIFQKLGAVNSLDAVRIATTMQLV